MKLILLAVFASLARPLAGQMFYVSPTGLDSNPGTLAQPFQTIDKARQAVRTVNTGMTGDITVYLRGGSIQQALGNRHVGLAHDRQLGDQLR